MRITYVPDRDVDALMGGRVSYLSNAMPRALVRFSERGGRYRLIDSPNPDAKVVSCPGDTTITILPDRTLVQNRSTFFTMDTSCLDAMLIAAAALCGLRLAAVRPEAFVVAGEGPASRYVTRALVGEDLCDEVFVASRLLADEFEDEEIERGTEGDAFFSEGGNAPGAEFLATTNPDVTGFKSAISVSRANGWTPMSEALRTGLPNGSVAVLCNKCVACKVLAVRMLVSVMEGGRDGV